MQNKGSIKLLVTILIVVIALAFLFLRIGTTSRETTPKPDSTVQEPAAIIPLQEDQAQMPEDVPIAEPGEEIQENAGTIVQPDYTEPPTELEIQESNELPAEFQEQLSDKNEELPEDLRQQLEEGVTELPPDLQEQIDAPSPEIPDDIKEALETSPQEVTIEEVNGPQDEGLGSE